MIRETVKVHCQPLERTGFFALEIENCDLICHRQNGLAANRLAVTYYRRQAIAVHFRQIRLFVNTTTPGRLPLSVRFRGYASGILDAVVLFGEAAMLASFEGWRGQSRASVRSACSARLL
jgi:hypothetical protein